MTSKFALALVLAGSLVAAPAAFAGGGSCGAGSTACTTDAKDAKVAKKDQKKTEQTTAQKPAEGQQPTAAAK